MFRSILLLSAFFSTTLFAQVTVLEPLNFGTIVVVKNIPGSSITLLPNGTSSATNIHLMQSGHPAELLIEGYGARVQLNISDMGVYSPLERVNGRNKFTLNNIIYAPSIITNAYGMGILKVGGQLSTSGNGQPYLDDSYSTTIELTISY